MENNEIMEQALSGYSAGNSLAGLNERVANHIIRSENRRRRITTCGVLLAIAAVLVAALMPGRATMPIASNGAHSAGRSAVVIPARRAESTRQAKSLPHIRRKRSLPKRESFPAPAPLSREERVLLAFVQRNPAAARQLFSSINHGPLEEKQ